MFLSFPHVGRELQMTAGLRSSLWNSVDGIGAAFKSIISRSFEVRASVARARRIKGLGGRLPVPTTALRLASDRR